MKVKDVLLALQKYDPEMDVYSWDGEYCCYDPLEEDGGIVEIEETPSCFGGYRARQGSGKKVVVI